MEILKPSLFSENNQDGIDLTEYKQIHCFLFRTLRDK